MAINKNDYLDANGDYELKKALVDELIDGVNIESGANTNGSWVKFPDGTMICYKADVAFSENAGGSINEVDWIFPQPFVNSNVSVNFVMSGNNAHWGSAADFARVASWGTNNTYASNTQARLIVRATTTFVSGVFRAVGLMAIGRWK